MLFATFQCFGSSHVTAIALIALATLSLILVLRKSSSQRLKRRICITLAIISFITYPFSVIAWWLPGPPFPLEAFIPLQLCNIAAVLAGIALITKQPLASELCYYWGLAGTVQGLLTPALDQACPDPIFFHFFLLHGIVVAIALILPLGLGWRPRRPLTQTINRSFLLLNLYALLAFVVNLLLKTNFGYLNSKPETASLLDHFGPWPLYILPMELLAYALFWLLSVPFLRRTQRRKPQKSQLS